MTAMTVPMRALAVAALALLAVPLAASPVLSGEAPKEAAKDAPKLYVHLETELRFTYAGDPARVSTLFKNEGSAPWINPGIDIEGGFEVFDSAGHKLEKAKGAAVNKDTQPKQLEPSAYFGKIVNLTALFPKLGSVGTYRITWSAPGVPEQTLATRIIRKYDPAKDYQAVIDTDFGKVVIEFYKDLAPFHVKNFIDLVNQDFYNGLLFHRLVKGELIFGGSPTGDERGSPGYNMPPEPNGLKVLPGVVAQVRNSLTGADESGSIFMIAATPQADMDNRVTVFARIVEGLDTVKAIANLPTVGGPPRVASRPIKDVVIRKIEIREKKAAKG
jgi:cyclophilin family peptidyl-prolyl cis-trans isomerase